MELTFIKNKKSHRIDLPAFKPKPKSSHSYNNKKRNTTSKYQKVLVCFMTIGLYILASFCADDI
jgi:hypothetical protein